MSRWYGGFRPPPRDIQNFERQEQEKEKERKQREFGDSPPIPPCSRSSTQNGTCSPRRPTSSATDSPATDDSDRPKRVAPVNLDVENEAVMNLLRIEFEQWNLTAAKCKGCQTTVPHNQLYICYNEECEDRFQRDSSIKKPSQFYEKQRVFCGACAFRGCHEMHSAWMEGAERLAIDVASEFGGAEIAESIEVLRKINDEEPVDYILSIELEADELPKMPVVEYLEASLNSHEWDMKKAELDQLYDLVMGCRRNGYSYVREMAREALSIFEKMRKVIDLDLNIVKPEQREFQEFRKNEHSQNMGINLPTSPTSGSVASTRSDTSSTIQPRSPMSIPSSVSTVVPIPGTYTHFLPGLPDPELSTRETLENLSE